MHFFVNLYSIIFYYCIGSSWKRGAWGKVQNSCRDVQISRIVPAEHVLYLAGREFLAAAVDNLLEATLKEKEAVRVDIARAPLRVALEERPVIGFAPTFAQAPAQLPHRLHQSRYPRANSLFARSVSAVLWTNRGTRASLLPQYRGQDRSIRRA